MSDFQTWLTCLRTRLANNPMSSDKKILLLISMGRVTPADVWSPGLAITLQTKSGICG